MGRGDGGRGARARRFRRRALWAGPVVLALALVAATAGCASPQPVAGAGSTFAALAMQRWIAGTQSLGLRVNYQPVGSPAGLEGYTSGLDDFAATEMSFASLDLDPAQGYQFIPVVAAGLAVDHHALHADGTVADLHLSPTTAARIFLGVITNWSDPQITADNGGVALPDQAISVYYRGGRSGTTEQLFDLIARAAPQDFAGWVARNGLAPNHPIADITGTDLVRRSLALGDDDLIARSVSQNPWTISYGPEGYARVYSTPVAALRNASGAWIKPDAAAVTRALERAVARPDGSIDGARTLGSQDPGAYPAPLVSYVVTPCAADPDRATCRGSYSDPGKAVTMTRFLRWIACEGQVNLDRIGYAHLSADLSQQVVEAAARLWGPDVPSERLSSENCPNPEFAVHPVE